MVTKSKYSVKSFDISTGEQLLELQLNTTPTSVNIIDNRTLYITAGKAIIKIDAYKKGRFFSFGDGEKMHYTYKEIKEWIRLFGDQFLEPLSEETRERYGIKD
ncbi:hypothetical protein [Dyadobacter sp. NIV53]|uniref:hypothetical protein n=1 Tax=Dyadobacter sp. NIV53 TaxID=2861765 RepID=UPI001C877B67|nr:hypothetical protein [Dyadobacter sp. NIV53]